MAENLRIIAIKQCYHCFSVKMNSKIEIKLRSLCINTPSDWHNF
ncbi:hypothetical protein PL10110_200095 [Planktothrix agardhii]|nr:hypothetical protein PL10110_200095 [Planktothrix agardhii]